MSAQFDRRIIGSVLFSTRPERQSLRAPLSVALIAHALLLVGLVWGNIFVSDDVVRLEPPAEREPRINMILLPAPRPAPARTNGTLTTIEREPKPEPSKLAAPSPIDVVNELPVPPARLDLGDFSLAQVAALTRNPDSVYTVLHEADLPRAPRYTAYSRAPVMRNMKAIQQFLLKKFPGALRRAGGEARAVLWLFIDAHGEVRNAVLYETSGRAEVDSVALQASQKMHFQPAQLSGRPVPVWVQQPVRLRVTDLY